MTHKGKLHYFSALQGYQFICSNCGEVILVDVGRLEEVEVEGVCKPTEALGISVKENVGVKDKFGGGE